jgi:death-on-curing protein
MKEPVWLHPHLVRVIHARLIAEHGGPQGIRDEGLLDAALAKLRQLHSYGDDPDLAALAAAYAAGIVHGHPFVDGNKRTGFAAAAIFLDRNGRPLRAPEPEATAMTVALAAGEIDEAAFARWLREST